MNNSVYNFLEAYHNYFIVAIFCVVYVFVYISDHKGNKIFTKKCNHCCNNFLIKELPGEFRDIDSDFDFPEMSGDGLGVCRECLGTNRVPIRFLTSKRILACWCVLSKEVDEIRNDNLILNQKIEDRDHDAIRENNDKLVVIAKEALGIVGDKAPKNCYARLIQK